MDIWSVALSAVLALGVACAVWGIGIERFLFTVIQEPQQLEVLPRGARPIRVLHISDIHMAPWQKRKQRWLQNLQAQDFDLVINTGDNLGHPNGVAPVIDALAPVLKKPGAFVNGSNDYYAAKARNPFTYLSGPSKRESDKKLDTPALLNAFEKSGWLNLNNAAGVLEICGTKIRLVGVDDPHEFLDDVESISKNAIVGSDELLIGVAHAPYLKIVNAMNDAGVKVLFAGHTHGGQVCVPGYGALVTNCDLPTKAAKGLSSWSRAGKQMWLNVCAGLGHSIYAPVRFACKPEVRIVELVAKN